MESDVEKNKTVTLNSCSNGAAERVADLEIAINAVFTNGEVGVSLVGESSIVFAFSPFITQFEIIVPDEHDGNVYGMLPDSAKKTSVSFRMLSFVQLTYYLSLCINPHH